MDYNSKYTGEQVEELLDKINASPEDVATPSGNYPDMTVGKASQADTAAKAINADNATNATNATTAEQATKATTADYATTAGQATTAESAKTATNADRATTAEHATTAESTTHADTATKANFATDLTGRNEATAEEFTFRPSAGNKSIRDDSATIKRIKGNSVVWNQLVKNGDFASADNWASNDKNSTTLTIEEGKAVVTSKYAGTGGDPVAIRQTLPPSVANHKYFVSFDFNTNNTDLTPYFEYYRAFSGFAESMFRDGNTYSSIFTAKESGATDFLLKPKGTKAVGDVWEWDNVMVIDLTQMFGAGNEPDTVEEFRALFPDNYYEYNPGQLVSMTANGLFTNGFNQWDEEWELGYLNADGTTSGYVQNYIRAKNYIPVIRGAMYYASVPDGTSDIQLYAVDENYNLIKHIQPWANTKFVIPDGAAYIRFYLKYGSEIYNNDICINLSHTGVENGKYEPYWDATKDLSIIQKYFPNGMRSAGSIYDEISFDETTQKWVAIQRVGNVDLGTLTWTYSNNAFISLSIESLMTYPATNIDTGNILCSKYSSHPYNGSSSLDKAIFTSWQTAQLKAIWIKDSAYSDAASFKTAMSGVILNYELAEPIITVIEEPINLSYKVGDFGVEQILSDSFSAPFRADIIYQFNATDRIRENSLNIEKLSKTQKDYLPLTGGTMSGQINSQDIKPVEDSTYQLGDSTHKYDNVFSNFFTGNLEGNAKTATVATDLSGRIEATPEVFTYRPSAGEKSIKDDNAFIRRVKGNSVVWNQLVNGSTYSNTQTRYGLQCSVTSNSREIRVVGTYVGDTSVDDRNFYTAGALTSYSTGIVGHKYLCHISGNKECSLTLYGWCSVSTDIFDSIIKECTSAQQLTMAIKLPLVADGTQIDETIIIDIHDLTQMFGAGNEPNTIEEFRALYPDSYYPYNAGELRNLDCSGIKTVGFNQWDEQWESGVYKYWSDGQKSDSSEYIRSTNFIKVIPANTYCLNIAAGVDAGVGFYDENNNFLGQASYSYSNNSRLFQIPANCQKITFYTKATTYNNDICINISHTGWRDGEYEPYKEVTHSLPLLQITNGEPLRYVYNSYAGEQYDEINETEYIKRIGVVDLGTLDWSWDEVNSVFKTYGLVGNGNAYRFFCSKYTTTNYAFTDMADKTIRSVRENLAILGIKDSSFGTDASALKASLAGVMLNYELAEPIVTPIETPIDFNYYVEDFGTEEALLTEDSAPFSADIVYQFNATDQIRNNSRNIDKLQRSAFTPSGTSSQYIRGDGSYGNRFELSQSTPINDGEFEITDEGDRQFILTPNYYAKSQVTLDNTTTIAVFVTAPEDSHYLAEYWFEFAADDTLPNIEYYQPNNSKAVFRIDGDMMTDAVNILHLISSDGGNTFFGEIRSYSL